MKIVRRTVYLQLGRQAYGRYYPPRLFPRDFTSRWAKPVNNSLVRFKKPTIVDAMVSKNKVKPAYRGLLRCRRGSKYAMGRYSRTNLDFHRTR